MFNIFLNTILNMLLLNYKASLNRSDFFKFWAILLVFYSCYLLCGYLMLLLDMFEYKFTFHTYFIEIFIVPFFSVLFLSLIYKAKANKLALFCLILAMPVIIFEGLVRLNDLFAMIITIFLVFIAIYFMKLIMLKNTTNLKINLSKKALILRLLALCFLAFIVLTFPPDLKFNKYGFGINYISILSFFNFIFLIPSFITILIYLIKNYKRLK
ncbi:hypothetical protein [Campylobacter sp. MG1]|uniref:hypothetical protein n=1 Tax=Campylobacter sp. MG1 TaxID=2976332 RepID=UPI00226C899B|nr:hypothetical protein [Campylobacter sp. MG1]